METGRRRLKRSERILKIEKKIEILFQPSDSASPCSSGTECTSNSEAPEEDVDFINRLPADIQNKVAFIRDK